MFSLVVLSLVLAAALGAPSHFHNIHQDRYDAEGKAVYITDIVDDSIQVHNAADVHDNAHLFTKEQLDNAPVVEADAFDEHGHYIHDLAHLAHVQDESPVVHAADKDAHYNIHPVQQVAVPVASHPSLHFVEDVHPAYHQLAVHSVHVPAHSASAHAVHIDSFPVAVSHSSRTDVHQAASIISEPVLSHSW